MNRMPLTGIWPEPVVTAMTWILANRLTGAKASDLDVSRICIGNPDDGSKAELSLVVTGANEHDVTQLDPVLTAILVKRKSPGTRRSKHHCADAGYRVRRALEIIESHGYIPHVVGRRTEADAKRRDPTKKARRWVVEVCHSGFNRFRKLLVRYEKLERSFMALNHIAAASIG